MTKRSKRIEALRNASKGVRPEELEQALLDAGFERRNAKGDHRRYTCDARSFTLDFGQKPVKPVYVRQLLAMLDEMAAEAEES